MFPKCPDTVCGCLCGHKQSLVGTAPTRLCCSLQLDSNSGYGISQPFSLPGQRKAWDAIIKDKAETAYVSVESYCYVQFRIIVLRTNCSAHLLYQGFRNCQPQAVGIACGLHGEKTVKELAYLHLT